MNEGFGAKILLYKYVICLLIAGAGQCLGQVVLSSPNGQVQATISVSAANRLQYQVTRNGAKVTDLSPLGITVNYVDLGTSVTGLSPSSVIEYNDTYPLNGIKTTATNHYQEIAVTVLRQGAGDASFVMFWRAFDDGIAYRYQIPGSGSRIITGEASGWKLAAGTQYWIQDQMEYYENVHQKMTVPNGSGGTFPVTCEIPDTNGYAGGYALLTEAALYHYNGMVLKTADSGYTLQGDFYQNPTWYVNGGNLTPWRVTMTTDSLNGLVNSTLIQNLNPAPQAALENADWIQPGRALWSWWYYAPADPSWDARPSDQIPYMQAAESLGFEYVVWDDGFQNWSTTTQDTLLQYAAENTDLGVWIWRRWEWLDTPGERDSFFSWADTKNAQWGRKVVVGIKVDFMDSESIGVIDWYEDLLQDAADHQIMVNFHGANKPTGYERRYPHEVTREGVRGLEYHIWGDYLPPSYNAALPFTRGLCGPTDYTPVSFSDARLGQTTYGQQLAMAFVLTSPVTHWADEPNNYLNSPARDVIEAAPTTWDETVVLDQSVIGDLTVMARRKGERWFLALVNGNALADRQISVDLSFLTAGKEYDAVLLSDSRTTQFDLERADVYAAPTDTLDIWMRQGGGFVAMFTPMAEAEMPDFDEDGDVDMIDFAELQRCITGPDQGPPAGDCEGADLDMDDNVDLYDVALFGTCATGAGVPQDQPDCLSGNIPDTVPDKAHSPSIPDGATGVGISPLLSWRTGYSAHTHQIYFGTTLPLPQVAGQSSALYSPGALAHNTTYYWRIDELNATGTTPGDVWSFTTRPPDPVVNLNRYTLATLTTGSLYYLDREYPILSMPTQLEGSLGIRTNNDDKSVSSSIWLTFDLNVEADVYVAYDNRGTPLSGGVLPSWISLNYTYSGLSVDVDDSASPMRLYVHRFPAGSHVVMGGNKAYPANGAGSNYFVLIAPTGN